jgi:hypothetical protein
MAVTAIASLNVDLYINDTAVGCAQNMSLEETTSTGENAAGAAILCRADLKAIAAGGPVSAAGTWSTTTDADANMTYRQLIELKDLGQPVKVAFGTATSGESQRVGMALITNAKQVSSIDPDKPIVTFTVSLLGVGPLAWVDNP